MKFEFCPSESPALDSTLELAWTKSGNMPRVVVCSAPVWDGLQVRSDWKAASRTAGGADLQNLLLSLDFP
jgi:hypothetical protein